jgi:PAS domain S-box-containing protein
MWKTLEEATPTAEDAALLGGEPSHSAEAGLCTCAADGAILSMDPAARRILGLGTTTTDSAPAADRNIREFTDPDVPGEGNPTFGPEGAPEQQMVDVSECLIHPPSGPPRRLEVILNRACAPGTGECRVYAILRDITERRQAERSLRESEEKFRRLAEATFDGLVVHDNERVLEVNEGFAAGFGYAATEMVGTRPIDLVAPESRSAFLTKVRAGYEGVYETTGLKKDGTKFPVEVSVRHVLHDGRRVRMGAVRDISDRKRAEQESASLVEQLESERALLQQVVRQMPSGVVIAEAPSGRLLITNDRAAEILHPPTLTADGVEDHAEYEGIRPDGTRYRENEWPLARAVQQGEITIGEEAELQRRDGTRAAIIQNAAPIRDRQGELVAGVLVFDNVTERKRAQEELRSSEERLRILFGYAPDAIFVHDMKGVFVDGNLAAEALSGYRREELIGKSLLATKLLSLDQIPKAAAGPLMNVAGGPTGPGEFVLTRKDGSQIPLEIRFYPVRLNGRRLALAMARDVSERKQAQERLKRSVEDLQNTLEATVHAVASTAEQRDPYTAGHQDRVSRLACAIGEEMGLPLETLEGIRIAATLHDIRKVSVPVEILNRPGRLTEPETDLIRRHSQIAHDILTAIPFTVPIAEIVLQHHERMDGSGYPLGLRGPDILLQARILAVADTIEAMASHRPFRPALGLAAALDEVSCKKGILYDEQVVDACLRLASRNAIDLD